MRQHELTSKRRPPLSSPQQVTVPDVSSTTTSGANTQHRTTGWMLAATGMLLVSTDTLFIRLSEAGTWDMAFLVAIFSLPIYIGLAWRIDDRAKRTNIKAHLSPLLLIGLLAGISQVAFIGAVNRTTVANVVTIVASAPIIAALVGWLLFDERVHRRIWTAITITMVGILVVVAGSLGSPTLDGDLLALVAIAAFGLSINVWRQNPNMSVFVGLALSAGFMLLIAASFAAPFSLDRRAYLAAFGMGALFNPLGRICHASAPRYAPAAEVALFTPVETVAAPVWAWLAFSEVPPNQTMVGAAIVITGVLYGTVFSRA